MNTPRKADLSPEELRALCVRRGIDPARLRNLAESPVSNDAAKLADYAQLRDYTDLTDVELRRVREPEEGIFIAESSTIIQRAHQAGYTFRSFFLNGHWIEPLAAVLAETHAPIYVGSEAQLARVAGFRLHRGALASANRPALPSVASVVRGARLVVVIEDLVDHTNVGAIFRSVAGLGADAVLVTPRCADPLYRRAIRVSMGTVFQVPWTRVSRWPDGLAELKDVGFHTVAMALDERAVSLREFAGARHERIAVIMGTEGDGLARTTLAAVDSTVIIPMHHGIDSLNVAAAAAVTCFALQEGTAREPQ